MIPHKIIKQKKNNDIKEILLKNQGLSVYLNSATIKEIRQPKNKSYTASQ